MSSLYRTAKLAGYLAATRSSEDPDLRRNDEDESEHDHDYNNITHLGGFLDSVKKEGQTQLTAAKTSAVSYASQQASAAASSAISSASQMATDKLNSVLGVGTAGAGSKFKNLPAWHQQALAVSGGDVAQAASSSIRVPSVIQGVSRLETASFYGDNPEFVSVLGASRAVKSFLDSNRITVPPAELLKPSTITTLLKLSAVKALKDAGLLNKLASGQMSVNEAKNALSRLPLISGVKSLEKVGSKSKNYVRPSGLPNVIRFSFEGDSADSQFRAVEAAIPAIQSVLDSNGFSQKPLTVSDVERIAHSLWNSMGVIHFTIYNDLSESGISSKNFVKSYRAGSGSLPAVVSSEAYKTSSGSQEPSIEEPTEAQTSESTSKSGDETKKKEGMSTGAIVGISAAVLLAVGAGVYYMRNKDNM